MFGGVHSNYNNDTTRTTTKTKKNVEQQHEQLEVVAEQQLRLEELQNNESINRAKLIDIIVISSMVV